MRWRHAIGLIVLLLSSRAGAADAPRATIGEETGNPAIVAQLRSRATQGDNEAALRLGLLYDTGKGVGQDFAEAIRWYHQAAEAGNAVAAFDLAALYDAGRGGARDPALALHWYQVAAERRLGRAAYVLGVMTESGDGIAPDPVAAAGWYRQALTEGVPAARDRLARLKAAAPGPSELSPGAGGKAFAQAAALWRTGGLDSGDPAALAALRSAAASGYPLAQYDLGYAYEHGVGIGPDLSLAYAWYKLAAASDGSPILKATAAVNRDRLSGRLGDDARQAADLLSAGLVGQHD